MNTHAEPLLNHCHRSGGYSYFWSDKPKQSEWFDVQQRPAMPNSRAINIYFGVHPTSMIPTDNASGEPVESAKARSRTALISAVNVMFAEFDAKDEVLETEYSSHLPENFATLKATEQKAAILAARITVMMQDIGAYKARAWAKVEKAPLCPTMFIDSGGGYHCYWFLAETVYVNENNRECIKQLQAKWVDLIGGDSGCKDLARVLRVPGTWNVKEHFKPNFPQVKVIEYEETRLYSLADFEEVLNRVSPVDDIETKAIQARKSTTDRTYNDVIAEFNRTNAIADLLTAHGYQISRNSGNTARLSRPGRDADQSSVVVFLDGDKQASYHHSSSDMLHTDNHTRDAFDIWTQLEHGGDTKRAYEAAKRAQGKWEEVDTEPQPPFIPTEPETEPEPEQRNPLDVEPVQDLQLGGLIDRYVNLMTELTGSPKEFNQIIGLTLLATVIGRNGYIHLRNAKIFCNLYTCILAQTTVWGKSTALNKGPQMLIRALLDQLLLADEMTPEGLIASLATQSTGIIINGEIGRIFDSANTKYLRDLKPLLTDLYDGQSKKRRLSKGETEIKNPHLSICGATTPTRFFESISPTDLKDGFAVRWLFALPPDGEPNFDTDVAEFTQQDDQVIGEIAMKLLELSRNPETQFKVDADALELYSEWRKESLKQAYRYGDETVLGAIGRYATVALKFAIIIAASNGGWGKIDRATMQNAIDLSIYYRSTFFKILTDRQKHGVSNEKIVKVFKVVRDRGGLPTMPDRPGITYNDVRRFTSTIDRALRDECLTTLMQMGAITEEDSGRGKKYFAEVSKLQLFQVRK